MKRGRNVVPVTRFTDPAAVDAWDRWFRWRNDGGLCDRTIEATWKRVAGAIAVDDGHAMFWAHRYVDAFSRWQLLPDERLLRTAGTGAQPDSLDPLSAALNVAAFVVAPLTRQARFDDARFSRIAALSIRLLDDAQVSTPGLARTGSDLRIGLIGFADALHLLGIGYDHARAAELARAVGLALAIGTLRGTSEMARERGAIDADRVQLAARGRARDLPVSLIEDMQRHGVRHVQLTAIGRQPRLALLANHASDALDPPSVAHRRHAPDPPSKQGVIESAMTPEVLRAAQRAVRAAIQPWIDAPIDDPLATACQSPTCEHLH